jgi:hypothetical protein
MKGDRTKMQSTGNKQGEGGKIRRRESKEREGGRWERGRDHWRKERGGSQSKEGGREGRREGSLERRREGKARAGREEGREETTEGGRRERARREGGRREKESRETSLEILDTKMGPEAGSCSFEKNELDPPQASGIQGQGQGERTETRRNAIRPKPMGTGDKRTQRRPNRRLD